MEPTPSDLLTRYEFARQLAQRAGREALSYFQRRSELLVEHKGGNRQDVVSIADRAVESLIRSAIHDAFPDDDFLGEESGGGAGSARCCWVVDPIDGTSSFVNGLPTWCVAIGVVIDGIPQIGVIYDPNHQELFHACAGQGAWLNEQPMQVHNGSQLNEGLLGISSSPRTPPQHLATFLTGLTEAGGQFVRVGSGALTTAWVAAGRLIGYYEYHMSPWDSLPGLVLTREAGGLSNDYLAGDGLLHGNHLLLGAPGVYPALDALRRCSHHQASTSQATHSTPT